jgi:hypothetical protein
MPHKKLSRNAPCPCGSGKKYKQCCCGKGFEYLEDEKGNIFKSIPMSDEMAEILEEQKQKFIEKFGREPGPQDKLFFDLPPLEHVEHFMVEGMKQAGIDPAVIYAFEKTGLMVTEANEHLISNGDRKSWEDAVREYRAKHEAASEDDDENEWFWFWQNRPRFAILIPSGRCSVRWLRIRGFGCSKSGGSSRAPTHTARLSRKIGGAAL